jgi:hypothetical protein
VLHLDAVTLGRAVGSVGSHEGGLEPALVFVAGFVRHGAEGCGLVPPSVVLVDHYSRTGHTAPTGSTTHSPSSPCRWRD